MAHSITVQYDLHPPQDTPASNLSSSKHHDFPLSNSGTPKQYYEGLRQAIAQAKSTLGEELTAWRDAVGDREQVKETESAKKDEDEEEEEEEE